MKKLFVFIVILLVLAVLFYFFRGQKQSEVQVPQPEVQEELQEPKPHEAAPIVDTCKDLRGDDQDQCYQNIAWESGNIEYCELIESERFRHLRENPPRDKCYSMLAAKLCDPDICEKIDEGQDLFTPLKCKQRISRLCP